MMVSQRNHLFQGLLFRFHVKFQGCTILERSHSSFRALLFIGELVKHVTGNFVFWVLGVVFFSKEELFLICLLEFKHHSWILCNKNPYVNLSTSIMWNVTCVCFLHCSIWSYGGCP